MCSSDLRITAQTNTRGKNKKGRDRMAERKSFMLYLDNCKQWEMLSDMQAGILIKALFTYMQTGEQLCSEDGMLMMAFSFITAQIDRDTEKYEETCKKRAEAGRKGGKQKQANLANATDASENKQDLANLADKDKEREKEKGTETDTEKEREINTADKPRHARKQQFRPPSVDEVRAYCSARHNGIDPQRFVDYYTANGWMQGKGKPIKDWKAAVRLWESHQEKPPDKHSSIDSADVEKLMNPYGGSSFDLSDFDKLVNRF